MALPDDVRLRPARDEDAPAIAAMANEVSLAALGVATWAEAALLRDWNAPGVDREHDVAVVEATGGHTCGYLFLESYPPHTSVVAIPLVERARQGTPLEAGLVEEGERRARRFLQRARAVEAVLIQQVAFAGESSLAGLLAERGYRLARSFDVMRIDFPLTAAAQATAPAGIEVRVMQVDELEAVHAAHTEAFADHWGEEEWTLDHFRHHVLHPDTYVPELWLVAWAGSEIAGYIGATPSREDPSRGYVELLGVRRAHRQRGLGGVLLRRIFDTFETRGATGCDLHVDRESLTGATRLYERAGMRREPRIAVWEKEIRPGRR